MNTKTKRQSQSNRVAHRARRAFTLIEIIVVVIIIGVLAAVVAPKLLHRVGQAKTSAATGSMASLRLSIDLALLDLGRDSPQSGDSVRSLIWDKPKDAPDIWKRGVRKESDLLDPWGNEYILVVPGNISEGYDIVSYGADGNQGGQGQDQDIIG